MIAQDTHCRHRELGQLGTAVEVRPGTTSTTAPPLPHHDNCLAIITSQLPLPNEGHATATVQSRVCAIATTIGLRQVRLSFMNTGPGEDYTYIECDGMAMNAATASLLSPDLSSQQILHLCPPPPPLSRCGLCQLPHRSPIRVERN